MSPDFKVIELIMAAKPSIPKGTRDFSPVEMAKRNYIFNTIREVYHLYGFQQIETPSMEMLSTLMGKYGEEGDKLLFKIQNSGDYFSGLTDEELLSRNAVKLASKFCEKGLRYDLTVPFARYVVMHRDEITFPFKGLDNVNAELKEKGISDEAIAKLQPIILLNGSNSDKLKQLKRILSQSKIGLEGIKETKFILSKLWQAPRLKNKIELDLTLARGLNYYTGAIFEVKALDVQIGSITGGGRYDNLTGVFGMPGVSGVGISFGADRIFDVLNHLNLYPKEAIKGTQLLFINFGEKEADYSRTLLNKVRAKGICAEVYPDASKMKKQLNYANYNKIPYVALIGSNEMYVGKFTLRDMKTGKQTLVTFEQLIRKLHK